MSTVRSYLIAEARYHLDDAKVFDMKLRLLEPYDGQADVETYGMLIPSPDSRCDAIAKRLLEEVVGQEVELVL